MLNKMMIINCIIIYKVCLCRTCVMKQNPNNQKISIQNFASCRKFIFKRAIKLVIKKKLWHKYKILKFTTSFFFVFSLVLVWYINHQSVNKSVQITLWFVGVQHYSIWLYVITTTSTTTTTTTDNIEMNIWYFI